MTEYVTDKVTIDDLEQEDITAKREMTLSFCCLFEVSQKVQTEV